MKPYTQQILQAQKDVKMKYLWKGYDGNGDTTAGLTERRQRMHLQGLHFNENGAKWKDSPKADDDGWFHEPEGEQQPTLIPYLRTQWAAEASPRVSCIKQQLQRSLKCS